MSTYEETVRIWQTADAVCFDVDSTVCQDEAIDEIAAFLGVKKEVQEITLKAMGGKLTFGDALSQRLNIINPSHSDLCRFIKSHPVHLTPRVKELIQALHFRGRDVFLVSGGFRCIIEQAAKLIGVPPCNIYANRLKFDFSGEFAGYDETQPTSQSGGKAAVCDILKERFGYRRLVMIGDGATDMEACPPADAFIGFGGNIVRESIQKRALWYVRDFRELISLLDD